MGCSASKIQTFVTKDSKLSSSTQTQCAYSKGCSTPLSRTLSLPASFVHHPPKGKGDTDHLVSLTSTTYGFLSHPQDPNFMDQDSSKVGNICDSPYSVINTWELMEGLDDFLSDFVDVPSEGPENVEKNKGCEVDDELIKDYEIVEYKDSKPLWQHLSVESLLANMDPNVGSSYRKALRSKRFGSCETKDVFKKGFGDPETKDVVKKGFGHPETKDVVKKGFGDPELDCKSKKAAAEMELNKKKEFDGKELHERSSRKWNSEFNISGKEDKIVLYYTSMRGIRKTYQDCCEIRMIFRDYRVSVDERDTSMDPSYRDELQDLLKGREMTLPQVFVRGKYIGGADQIRKLHEAGHLGEILKGFPILDLAFACDRCGDARFVLCLNCSGSRKVFEENKEKMRCLECNENGLVRCPSC